MLPHPNAFHPAPYALFYAPPALGPLPFFAPVYLVFGAAPLAYNIAYLGSLTLAAFGVAEVIRRWTDCHEAGFVAGLGLLTFPDVRYSVGTAPLCAMLAGLPWLAYAGAKRNPDRRTGALLVGSLAVQGFVDPLVGLLAALVPLALIGCARLIRPSRRRDGLWFVSCVALTGALLSPLIIGYLVAWRSLDPGHPGPWSAVEAALQQFRRSGVSVSLPSAPEELDC